MRNDCALEAALAPYLQFDADPRKKPPQAYADAAADEVLDDDGAEGENLALRCVAGMRRLKRAQFIYKLAAYSTYPEQSPGM